MNQETTETGSQGGDSLPLLVGRAWCERSAEIEGDMRPFQSINR